VWVGFLLAIAILTALSIAGGASADTGSPGVGHGRADS
jgi:hypothetical protein